MSKTVDILLIGGSWNGATVNSPLPVPLTIHDGEYVTQIYSEAGEHYRVATVPGVASPQIAQAIIDFQHNPSWDLRPPYGNYTPPGNGSQVIVQD
jgi:hypothetical protein